ncbi:MFS transporter [Draconibacterium mangrovi]|uniref:MFS transporter n=1 Tax=Draconibacterium mangrovi TaxID=2697469 RepID=UPI0013D1C9AF|nr:MFS transporter [Draconibacterium mangrovi]
MHEKQVTIPGWLRWVALVAISLTMFGSYYMYDSVAYVAKDFIEILGFSQTNIGQLYTMYSIAAVIVLFFSGVFIDKYGTRVSMVLFGAICSLAGFVTAFSDNLTIILIGRFILGFGSEPLIVALTVALAKWFKGKELGFALGINLLIGRGGSYFVDRSNTWASSIYDMGWQPVLYLAAGIGLLCFFGGVIYYFIERWTQKRYVLGKAEETEKLDFKGLFKYSPSFWYVVILCLTFYSAIFPFRGFAPTFYQDAHGVSEQMAGKLNSVLIMATMFATPVIGLLIDKIGRRALMMFIGSIIILPVYLMFAYGNMSLYIPVALMGISFSLIPAVMWPSVAYIVEESKLGTAYALMTLLQQLGVAAMAWLIGVTNDVSGASASNPEGYIPGMWIFSILGFVGLLFSFLLRRAETGPKGHGLEEPSGSKE